MINETPRHMMDRPYIKAVIRELENLELEEDAAKIMLVKYYKVLRRSLGFELNAVDFAKEIVSIDTAVNRKHDPSDPNQVFIGHLKGLIQLNKQK